MSEPLVMTVEQAARLLVISRGLAYQGVRDGSIPSISIGRRRLVPRARLLELLGATNGEGVSNEMNERRATGGATQPENSGDPVP